MRLQQLNINFSKIPKAFSQDLSGKWVALLDGQIIAYNTNFKDLFMRIKEDKIEKKVLFHKVSKNEIIIV
jgi:hypothetical protein